MGDWREVIADVGVAGTVGVVGQGIADRWAGGTKKDLAFGVTAVGSGVLGLALKLWSMMGGPSRPTWQDDVGDPLVVAGSVLGAMAGVRALDERMNVIQPTTVPDAVLGETAYEEAVTQGILPAGLPMVDPTAGNAGVEISAQDWTQVNTAIPLEYDSGTGLWDPSSSSSST